MRSRRHNLIMPPRRSADTTPDLFSVAPAKRDTSPGNLNRDNPAPHPRHLLPKDLAGALKHLGDIEFDTLLAAITADGERRGRLKPTQGKAPKMRQTEDASRLTSGQLNAVRAAFKAGVKPSAIARQFRISQSEVRKVLAKVAQQSKSGR
jgi:hypothetical protein